MANKVKAIWDQGKAVVNGWLAIPSGFTAEMMARCGLCQHPHGRRAVWWRRRGRNRKGFA
jgi:hypothetical protein